MDAVSVETSTATPAEVFRQMEIFAKWTQFQPTPVRRVQPTFFAKWGNFHEADAVSAKTEWAN